MAFLNPPEPFEGYIDGSRGGFLESGGGRPAQDSIVVISVTAAPVCQSITVAIGADEIRAGCHLLKSCYHPSACGGIRLTCAA